MDDWQHKSAHDSADESHSANWFEWCVDRRPECILDRREKQPSTREQKCTACPARALVIAPPDDQVTQAGIDGGHTPVVGRSGRYIFSRVDRESKITPSDQYRTTDRVFVPYNDWIEGHTIEPGTFTGTDYGTTYLEVVK